MTNNNQSLQGYKDQEGKFNRLPGKKQKKKLDLMVQELANNFEFGHKYTEIEVNQILNQFHTFNDPATLRRLLFGMNFMNRSKDGRAYWRTETV